MASGSNNQTVCHDVAIGNIVYNTTGATGATVSPLPAGVTGVWNADKVTISGTPTETGTFNYVVTLTGGCGNITASGTIISNPDNTIVLTSGSDNQTVCVNTPMTNIVYTTTGATGASFTGLPSGLSVAFASNSVTISGSPTATGTYNYKITLTGGCGNVFKEGTITVAPVNTITLTSPGSTVAQSICLGSAIANITYATVGTTSVNVTGLPLGVTYTWLADVVTISGTPSTVAGSPFSYTVASTGPCGVVSKSGTITVNPVLPVSVSITADAATTCTGTTVNFTSTPVNGGTPTYQWYNGAVPVGTNSKSFSSNTLSNGDVISVVMTSSLTCVSGSPATSNLVTMTVNPVLPVSVSITADATTICAGTTVNFQLPVNGGTPTYQWYNGAVPVGTNSATFSSNTLSNGDVISVVMTSSLTCVSSSPATSNLVTMTVNPVLPVSVSITADATTICAGTTVNFTAHQLTEVHRHISGIMEQFLLEPTVQPSVRIHYLMVM
ncbi:MAG: hypothetical protein IPN68_19725 [Bacteroidetes bacterium]|nr:hypothetical protein [Bacteroidota bacterium]